MALQLFTIQMPCSNYMHKNAVSIPTDGTRPPTNFFLIAEASIASQITSKRDREVATSLAIAKQTQPVNN